MALPADFSKIFASTATGGITPPTDVNYAKGWEWIGANPPEKNDFNYLQNLSDLKSKWLYDYLTSSSNAASRTVGTGVNQIPDMSKFTSGSNWIKFPDGTLIQTGVSLAGYLGSPTDVTFPVPFPSLILSIVASFDQAASGANDCPAFGCQPLGNAGFRLMSSRTIVGTSPFARWIAIGR